MPATIAAAKAGVTTGEWTEVLRDVFGEYRGPTGIQTASGNSPGLRKVADRSPVSYTHLTLPTILLV